MAQLAEDAAFDVSLSDGRVAHCQSVVSQPYTDAAFSAGLVEGIEPDTLFLRLEKAGEEPTTIFMRPDEMQAVCWVCSGALWSQVWRDREVAHAQPV